MKLSRLIRNALTWLGVAVVGLGCSTSSEIDRIRVRESRNERVRFETVVVPDVARGLFPSAVIAAKFAGRELPDFAVTTWGDFHSKGFGSSALFDGSLAVILGTAPNGRRLSPTDEYEAGRTVGALAVGDLNRDGHLDIAVVSTNSLNEAGGREGSAKLPGQIRVFLGIGDGTFRIGPVLQSPVPYPRSIAVADLDGDGFLDIIVGNQSRTARAIGILFGQSELGFRATRIPVSGSNNIQVAVGTLFTGRDPDVVVLNLNETGGTPTLSFLRNFGNGKLAEVQVVDVGHAPLGMGLGPLKGKNNSVLVQTEDEGLQVISAEGGGTYRVTTRVKGTYGNYVGIADLDGDGFNDVVVFRNRETLSVLYGDGKGGFISRTDLKAEYTERRRDDRKDPVFPIATDRITGKLEFVSIATSPTIVDVDGDGRLDIVVPASSLTMEAYSKGRGADRKLPLSFLVFFLNHRSVE